MSRLRFPSTLALVTLLAGCAAQLPYTPNDGALEGMTRDQREQLFVETLSRARKPRIVHVWIDDSSYGYEAAVAVRDGFGIPVGYYPRRTRTYFANIRELRLYDNNAVFVIDTSGETVDKIVFGYRDDAQRMIDLMAAYRARRYSATPDTEPPRKGAPQHRERQPPPYDPRSDRRYAPPPGYYPPPGGYPPPPGYYPPPPGYDGPPPGWQDGPPPDDQRPPD